MDKSTIHCHPKIHAQQYPSRYGGSEIYILVITFDEVLPAHPQVTLIEVDNPLGRVLDVSRNREIEEVVSAVSLRSEAIVQLLPGINER